jgi:acyl-lipid omega-6 desaturase (Delta-12 desaturase)
VFTDLDRLTSTGQVGRNQRGAVVGASSGVTPLEAGRFESGDTAPQPAQHAVQDVKGAREWARLLARYRGPDVRRSVRELAITALPLAVLWLLAWLALERGWWWALLLTVPAAGFLVRLFMIQHDCGHGAFFRKRAANEWIGRAIGVLTLTPYDHWRRTHAVHHATSGNLDRRGPGAIHVLTVQEYLRLAPVRRWLYRLYRHPWVLFGLAPTFIFLLQNRLPLGFMRAGWRPWVSVMSTNLTIAAFLTGGAWLFGAAPFLLVQGPTLLLAATIGVWLFYIQHQFEQTSWAHQQAWNRDEAALWGSSYYDLPPLLRWFSANIGMHHVHHLSSRIPFYRLSEVLRDHPQLKACGRVSVRESIRSVELTLWDETNRRLIPFREIRNHAAE